MVCGAGALTPTGEAFEVTELLRRWEREAGVSFSESVWRDYGPPGALRVARYRCGGCGFGVFDPVLTGTSDFYSCITAADGSCYTAEKWEFLQAAADLRRHGCRSVLDVGAGSGYFLDLLRERLPEVERCGYEFNREMADLVRSKGHLMFDGEFPEAVLAARAGESFDAVSMFHVIEHVEDPVALIRAARRLLKPGGLLLGAVPDNEGPVRHFSTALTELPPHHVSHWRASSFKAGMPRWGFELVRVATEPLPDFLWEWYLPVMLEHSPLPGRLVAALNKNNRLVRVLRRLPVRRLHGVPGLSMYVVGKKAGDPAPGAEARLG